jgi:benzil reductase ((S)-benzoin forming)
MSLRNKTVVITGASRGLGAGIAREMFRKGVQLALCSRSEPALPPGERVVSARFDITDEVGLDAFVQQTEEKFGTIDAWINNAGVLEPIAPLRDISVDDFRRSVDVNVIGVFLGTRAFVRHVRSHAARGVLINISSGAARNGYAGWSAYCAGKAAVDLMTESVQVEEASSGLRAYSVAPGIIDTGMQELIREQKPENFPMVEKFREIKRNETFSTPQFVAGHLLNLAFGDDPPDEVRTSFPLEHPLD